MTYLLITQLLVIVGLIWRLDRQKNREIVTIHGLLEMQDTERQAMFTRIDNLLRAQHEAMSRPHPDLSAMVGLVERVCQRLQAPEQAVIDHSIRQPDPPVPPTVSMFDDDAYWEAMNVPKDKLAEDLMSQELDGPS